MSNVLRIRLKLTSNGETRSGCFLCRSIISISAKFFFNESTHGSASNVTVRSNGQITWAIGALTSTKAEQHV